MTLTPGTLISRQISSDASASLAIPLGLLELLLEEIDLAQRAVDRLAFLGGQLEALKSADRPLRTGR
jgi:hypothetical protein